MLYFIIPAITAAAIVYPLYRFVVKSRDQETAKRRVLINLASFGGICLFAMLMPMVAFAAAPAAPEAAQAAASAAGWGYIAAALSTGLSALGAGIAVAAAAPAAIGAFSEDPKAFGKAMIFVVMGEGVAIYGVLISILILNSL